MPNKIEHFLAHTFLFNILSSTKNGVIIITNSLFSTFLSFSFNSKSVFLKRHVRKREHFLQDFLWMIEFVKIFQYAPIVHIVYVFNEIKDKNTINYHKKDRQKKEA